MSDSDQLKHLADQMSVILSGFQADGDGIHIGAGDQAKFTALALTARELLDDALGAENRFGLELECERQEGLQNFGGSQSYHSVEAAISIVRAAADTISWRAARPHDPSVSDAQAYVSLERIAELRAISSASWDLRRLIRMCEEINSAFAFGNYLSVAMLLRAITDHVPPIFGKSSFRAYASEVPAKSLKGSMEQLQLSLRNIADGILHAQISSKEVLPSPVQVDFRQSLDVLLGEVVRNLR